MHVGVVICHDSAGPKARYRNISEFMECPSRVGASQCLAHGIATSGEYQGPIIGIVRPGKPYPKQSEICDYTLQPG